MDKLNIEYPEWFDGFTISAFNEYCIMAKSIDRSFSGNNYNEALTKLKYLSKSDSAVAYQILKNAMIDQVIELKKLKVNDRGDLIANKIKLSLLILNDKNPRNIKKENLKKLINSIESFEKMMSIRPIIIDEDNIILGGNMRFQALKSLKYDYIPVEWVKKVDNLTPDEKKEFIIKDNISFGEWDFDILANDWDYDMLQDWGFDEFLDNPDYPDKNKESDIDNSNNEEYIFKLEYTKEEYTLLKEKLSHKDQTPEQIFYKALI